MRSDSRATKLISMQERNMFNIRPDASQVRRWIFVVFFWPSRPTSPLAGGGSTVEGNCSADRQNKGAIVELAARDSRHFRSSSHVAGYPECFTSWLNTGFIIQVQQTRLQLQGHAPRGPSTTWNHNRQSWVPPPPQISWTLNNRSERRRRECEFNKCVFEGDQEIMSGQGVGNVRC